MDTQIHGQIDKYLDREIYDTQIFRQIDGCIDRQKDEKDELLFKTNIMFKACFLK